MQSLSTMEKISRLINKIKIDWDRVNQKNHGVSRIDKDILMDDIRRVYDLVYELEVNKVASDFAFVEESDKKSIPFTDELLPAQKEIIEDTVGEKQQEEKRIIARQNLPRETKPVLEQDAKTVPDLFSAAKTLADVYQDDRDNSLAAKIKHDKIIDIKAAIGINDKFLFINDIFKGEMSAYNQAIDQLNQADIFSDVIHIIDQLKLEYGNEENKTSFNKLFEFAKRKFH
jgi:phage regulator Rha-like protein